MSRPMPPPNLLILHSHDLGDFLSCYPDRPAGTPHLQGLADSGVVFQNHHAPSPTCSPSRGALMTGLQPHRNGLMGLAVSGIWELDPATPNLWQLLRQSGYEVASFGAWHVGRQAAPHWNPQGTLDEDAPAARAVPRALSFLESRPRAGAPPFCLSVGIVEPHRPFRPSPVERLPLESVRAPAWLPDDPVIRREMQQFHTLVGVLDDAVGRILAKLSELGLEEDTAVLFVADHGIGMPLAKGTLYEPGTKVAAILRWPGRLPAGRRVAGLSSHVDWLPTLLALVGRPDLTPPGLDGCNLLPALTHPEAPWPRQHVFTEQTWHDFYEPIRAVRDERYRLIRNFVPVDGWQLAADCRRTPTAALLHPVLRAWPRPAWELYDLREDPTERRNLAEDPAGAAPRERLEKVLLDYLTATGDPILRGPVPAPPGYAEFWLSRAGNGPGGLTADPAHPEVVLFRLPLGAVASAR